LTRRDWQLAGPLLNQLNQLEPDNSEYSDLAKKIGRKLVSDANAAFAERKYAAALRSLDAVPSIAQESDYQQLRTRIEDLQWLHRQFEHEVFDTPMLGRLAVRLQKDEPDEPRNQKRVQRLATSLKQAERPDRTQYPYRGGYAKSWIGGDLGYLSALTLTDRPDIPQLRSRWGQMNVAFGLALQGIGEGRIQTQLVPRKGLLKRLTQKKSKLAWGMDVGSYSIKVVALQRGEEGIELVDAFIHDYDQPLCRPGYGDDSLGTAAEAIETIMEEHDFGDAPVWINMPATELITRFTLLPPVADKQAKLLLDKEVEERIPLESDVLTIHRWMAPFDADSTQGRPAVITAVKNRSIEDRLERLSLTGLNIAGMQADPLALVNLVSVEFAEELEAELDDEEKTPTIALVDCGADKTSVIFVSKNAHWIWTVEHGGEDLTGLLARELKENRSEANDVKHNPHTMPHPAGNYAPVETRMDEWKSRLTKLVEEARVSNPAFQVCSTFGTGGCCLTHQWFRRVLSA